MDEKEFDLGTVLTITTGLLLTKIENVYKILDWMTGESLFTHQLPRVGRECEPEILSQFPELKNIDVSNVNKENWKEFLENQKLLFGNSFYVKKISPDKHISIGAIEELCNMIYSRREEK